MPELPRQTDGDLMVARQDAKALYGALDVLLEALSRVDIVSDTGAVADVDAARDEAMVLIVACEEYAEVSDAT